MSQHIHGTDNSRCLISLALMCGQVGRPGTGLHPLRGQNNVQGASDAGLIPMFLPDYQSVTDDGVRSAFNEIWKSDNILAEKGLTVTEIMDAAHDGEISAMYVLGENPAMSDPDVNHARDALANHLEEGGVVVALLDVAPGALTLRDRAEGTLLGRPVDLPVGILRLALEKGAPVIPYDGWLDGNRRVLEFHEPARGSEPETLLQEILATCEGVIRNRPWTWQAWLDADRLWATAQED